MARRCRHKPVGWPEAVVATIVVLLLPALLSIAVLIGLVMAIVGGDL